MTDERVRLAGGGLRAEPGPAAGGGLPDGRLAGGWKTLTTAEQLAFVLHDMFGLPFGEIAPMVGRSPATARQLASRARRRVRGADLEIDAIADPERLGRLDLAALGMSS